MDDTKIRELTWVAVEKAQKFGASLSEAYCTSSRQLSVEVRDQEIDTMKISEDQGLGLRVFVDNQMGFAFTTDLSLPAVEETIKKALDNASITSLDEQNLLPEPPGKDYLQMPLYDPAIMEVPLQSKIQLTKEMEKMARAYDRRVTITESCTYQDSGYVVALANSLGINASYRGAFCGFFADVVAQQDGDSQTGFDLQYSRRFQELDPGRIGRRAAQKAVRMLGAKEIRTQRAAVVFDPYVSTNFLGVIAPALSAEAVQKGKSLLAGKIKQKVASPLINIIDDGTRQGEILSAPFDGEGVPTRKTELILKGILCSYLHNTYTASKDGIFSTGNGIRYSFKGVPEVGTTNIYIKPGNRSREELLREVDRGLLVTQVMGIHTANSISGDFSVGVAGLWIEKGEPVHPVRGVTIAGNIVELLRDVDAVADDLTFFVGRGSPTLRISQMTISGG